MKNKFYIAATLLAILCGTMGCSEAENYEGGDSKSPVATIYPNANAKTYQVDFRVAPNTRVEVLYFLTEPTFARAAYIAQKGEAEYIEYVRTNGQKVERKSFDKAFDYLVNPDNNNDKSPDYNPTDNLIGYISTTVVAEGAGGLSSQLIQKNCYSDKLSFSSLMRGDLGDWTVKAEATVTETSLNTAGQGGDVELLKIENTDLVMIPALWFFAWEEDFDFMTSDNLIVRIDPKTGEPIGVVTTTISSGYDDQKNGVIGFGYDGSKECSFVFDRAAGLYTLTGFLLYDEKPAIKEGKPVMMTIQVKLTPAA